jgi:hypothetical protein
VRNALADLPWVDTNSILVDFEQKLVAFRVMDREQYSLKQALAAVHECGEYKASLTRAGAAIPTP